MADVSVNGRRYRTPERPTVVDLLRRLRSGLHRARHRRRHPADHRLVPARRLLRHRRFRRAELHQPQQRLDRHRRAAGRARHLRQLLSRPRHRRGAHDHRRLADALRHHPGRHVEGGRQDGRRHRQGQAAPDAGARAGGHQLLLRARRPRDARRPTASATSRPWSAGRSPTSTRRDLSLYVLDAGLRLLERKAATLLYLSLSDFVQHAHAPGTPEADAFNRARRRPHRRHGGGRRHRRRGRRSRHERQVARRRRAQRRLPARRSSTAASATAPCA